MLRVLILFGLCFPVLTAPARGQGETAVPFLLLPVSARSNGMGGAGTALVLDDPLSVMGNPAQVGSFSLHGTVALGFTPSAAEWWGRAEHTGYGIMGGYRLDSLWHLPLGLSVGIGYTHGLLDYGTFVRTGSQGPEPIGTFEAWERANGLSVGFGIEYGIRLGVGGTVKWITSRLSPIGTEQEMGSATAEVTAYDGGFLLEAPVGDFVMSLVGTDARETWTFRPVLDFSASCVWSNIGDEIVYIDADQADPLPRNATTGIGMVAGLEARIEGMPWTLGTVRWTRQGEDVLVTRNYDGTWVYKTGLGDMDFWNDVVLGKTNPEIARKVGWEVEVGEVFALRGGSHRSAYGPALEASGFGIRLDGLLKGVRLLTGPGSTEDWLAFLTDHLTLRYDTGSRTSDAGSETTYSQITVMLAALPW